MDINPPITDTRVVREGKMDDKKSSGFKRDRQGNAKKFDGSSKPAPKPVIRNAFTPMFENLRDELDAHHDRRDRLGKTSRDITALSKKMFVLPFFSPGLTTKVNHIFSIFSLQRYVAFTGRPSM